MKKKSEEPPDRFLLLEFKTPSPAHRVAGIIYDYLLGLHIPHLQTKYDDFLREYVVRERRNGNYLPLFSINFPGKPSLKPCMLQNKMELHLTHNLQIPDEEDLVNRLKTRVEKWEEFRAKYN